MNWAREAVIVSVAEDRFHLSQDKLGEGSCHPERSEGSFSFDSG
jgi:hypothetical protein